MAWTFEMIAKAWREINSHGPTRLDRETAAAQLVGQLTGSKRGWFEACRSWAYGGPGPDDYPEISRVLNKMDEDRLLPGYDQKPFVLERRQVAQLHVECADAVRSAVAPEGQWTSRGALTAEEERNLQRLLEELAAERKLTPPYGPAFLRDLAAAILDPTPNRLRRPHENRCETLFPLVPADPDCQEPGVLALFDLERLAEGTGELFIAPEQAFTPLEESFAQVFADATAALRESGELRAQPQTDVRVRILKWQRRDSASRESALLRMPLRGGSGGGALALGLWSLWTGTPLEPWAVISFSLRNPKTGAVDGGCYPIGGDGAKAHAAAQIKGGACLFLVAMDQSVQLDAMAAQMRLRVERAARLDTARVIAVGAGEYLRRRLEVLRVQDRLYTPLAGYTNRRPTAAELIVAPRLFVTRGGEADSRQPELVRDELPDLRELLREGKPNGTGNYVLVGAPGGGKTFTLEALEYLALEQYREGGSLRLPVFLPLRVWDRATGEAPEALKGFVCAQAPELAPIFDDYLKQGRFLFLCDALNEMPKYERESKQVKLLTEWINAFGEPEEVAASDPPRCRFIFTCRTENYQVTLPARRVDVAPLDDGRRAEMARNYLGGDPGPFLAALQDRGVWGDCATPQDLLMYIALYVAGRELPRSRGGLYRGVCDLRFEYEARRIAEGKPSPAATVARETVETGMQALAYRLHDSALSSGTGIQTDLTRGEAESLLTGASAAVVNADSVLDAAQELRFLQIIRVDRLFPRRDRVRFGHQRWQEFWTAVQVGQEESPEGQPFTPEDWRRFFGCLRYVREVKDRKTLGLNDYDPLPPPEPTGWEEPLLMLAGIDLQADAFVEQALAHNPVFAARCLYEGRATVTSPVEQNVAQDLLAIVKDRTVGLNRISLRDRIAAGDALGYLGYIGDRRIAPNAGPIVPEMVEMVPPGTVGRFVMGSTAANLRAYKRQLGAEWDERWAEDEQPAHEVELSPYRIGKYPVTWREFGLFVEDGGYREETWWIDEPSDPKTARSGNGEYTEAERRTDEGLEWLKQSGQEVPHFWNDPVYHKPNAPVVGVCWYEAVAYLRWLSWRVGEPGKYRLPTEAEWEYAARGAEGRLWPWGNQWPDEGELENYLNGAVGDTYAGRSTPVGLYRSGSTGSTPAEEVYDLAGNVWEWCSDWYGGYSGGSQRNPGGPKEGDSRVLRGGSWILNNPDFFRSAFRFWCAPVSRLNGNGFRGACGL